ncbi:glycosyltransferase [Cyclobacterium sp.]|uniref:glycosyltransferase n=1 Tax=Cyclobacterium sp. TaxID=1966343 RepID=UPI0019BC55AA|nr:glycosyltransferase [Cyclobacterium sp.]MBD3627054.1 glycosyltransferase [Cyclobacterium sp.]
MMRKKIPIVLASILKPVNDSRMLFKLGFSLRETNKYHLNIIGFSSKKIPISENINFKVIFSKNRTHPSRILVPFKFFFQLLKIKPRIVIVSTYELLPMAVLGKAILSYKLVYDVQENYLLNLQHNQTLFGFGKFLAKMLVFFFEKLSHPFIDHFLFAEKCFVQEMPAIKNHTVIQNKAHLPEKFLPSFRIDKVQSPHFLLTGTIARVYGVSAAIDWFIELRRMVPGASLYVIGHCPMPSYASELQSKVKTEPGIHLQLSPNPLPHPQILREILKADILLLPYKLLPSIRDKIPTKLYEGIAHQKPILITKNEIWEDMIQKYPAGIVIDFGDTKKIKASWEKFSSMYFYKIPPGIEVSWQAEKKSFQQLIEALL